jgi:hypothetical protein
MHVINAINVRDALPKAVKYLLDFGIREKTRVGDAMVARSPVCIRYYYPKQHVLVNPIRDANPFFHLMEAMWMLAGREDGVFLDHYIKNFSKDFGVNGIIPDAYGYRWRYGGCDQLLEIAKQLKANPTSRQAVLQMWGAKVGECELTYDGPKACNLVTTFRIREGKLDMTVFNRSNDLIWGACGANAVHFPIMQEYLASMIGVRMGEYWQISNNLHLYQTHIDMLQKRRPIIEELKLHLDAHELYIALKTPFYEQPMPLIEHPETFDEDLFDIMILIDLINRDEPVYEGNISNPFLKNVVLPMAHAHRFYKTRAMAQALIEIENVVANDWKRAGKEWLQRHTSIQVGEEEYGQPV